jgi:cytochrome c553
MSRLFVASLLPALMAAHAPLHAAADAEAGRAKAQAVCAACHGANGISVSDTIPNLAGQRAAYLENQLKALKSGARKSPVMNAIGAQLSAEEMGHLAAWFAQLPAASAPGTKSAFMPALAASPVSVPENYRSTYTKYLTLDMPETKQVRYAWASPVAAAAAKAGKPLPDGSVIVIEVNSAKLDADRKPIVGADGHLVPDQTTGYSVMAREAGWGDAVPEMLRNQNWRYALFNAAKQQRPGINQAECLACHKPQDKASYLFTLDQLGAAVR